MNAPVAIFGVGNRSRGDDALGPLLLDRLRGWLEARNLGGRFELFEEYQLQLENALDLEGRELVLVIDAQRGPASPVSFTAVAPLADASAVSSHALEPGAMLLVHRRITGREPPPAFALGLRAASFELGEGLSEVAKGALGKAWPLLMSLAGNPQLASWQFHASTFSGKETPMATRKVPAKAGGGEGRAPAAPKVGAKPKMVKADAVAPAAKQARTTLTLKAGKAPVAAKPGKAAATTQAVRATAPAQASKVPAAPESAPRPRKPVAKAAVPGPDRVLMVAQAAYFRAERRGFAPGGEHDDWLAAEAEIERLLGGR